MGSVPGPTRLRHSKEAERTLMNDGDAPMSVSWQSRIMWGIERLRSADASEVTWQEVAGQYGADNPRPPMDHENLNMIRHSTKRYPNSHITLLLPKL